jgi:hypothetical protein
MAYSVISKKSGKTFFLHCKQRILKNGKTLPFYYFATTQGEGAVDNVPEGYEVLQSEKMALPMLKKKS